MVQAVFSTTIIVWLSSCPECDIPGTAVCPFPCPLHLYVVASQPDLLVFAVPVKVRSVLHSLQHKVIGGSRMDRSQVASFLPAEVFSISPVLLVGAPQIAVLSVLLPVFFAGFNAIVVAAT